MMLGILPCMGSLRHWYAIRRRSVAAWGVVAVAFGVLLAFGNASARAEFGHPLLGSFGSFTSVKGLGVDESAGREGNVYVVNGGGPEVVEVFNEEGLRPPTGGSPQQLTGATTPQGSFVFFEPVPAGVAVDNSESVANGDVYVNNVLNGVVDKFRLNGSNEYEYVSQLEGFGLAVTVDSLGDVYVANFGGAVEEYTAEGVLVGQFASPSIERPNGVAVDTAGDIYIQDYEAPHKLVELKRSSMVSTEVPSESTIAESVSGIALDRATDDLFVDFGSYVEEFNGEHAVISTFGQGLVEGSDAVAVAEKSEAIYVDSGSVVLRFGPAVAPTAPKIEEVSATAVSGSSATLQAQITPDWSPTSYHFEYGPGESYGTSIPVSAGEIHPGGSGVPVSVHVQGLSAGTVYHYRVVASNEVGASFGSDHTFTTQPVGGEFVLPDIRQYELVSPANKHGGEVQNLEGIDEGGIVRASEEGDAVTYLSFTPFEASPPSNGLGQQYVSRRGGNRWTTQNISAPVREITPPAPGQGTEYNAFSMDLSRGIEFPFEFWREEGERGERRLSPEAPREFEDIFMWREGIAGFQPLVTSTAPNTKRQDVKFEGASPDLNHVIFSSEAALTANAQRVTIGNEGNLYYWVDGAFQLVSVLPDGKTTTEEGGRGATLGRGEGMINARNAVSGDGSRVIWSNSFDNGLERRGHLYESDMTTGKSVQVDAPQGGVLPHETTHAAFETGTVDGSKVFFASDAPLTSDANTGQSCGTFFCSPPGRDLYVFNAATGGLTDLTPDHDASDSCQPRGYSEPIPSCGAQVQGVIGASEDGAYVYVVANGVLAAGASLGNCQVGGAEGPSGSCNLYLLHYDGSSWTTTFIAKLSGDDEADWRSYELARMTARISPNGRYLALMSLASLTGYDNTDAVSGQPDLEVYLYEAGSRRLVCVSCNPTGVRPSGQKDSHATLGTDMDPEQAWGKMRPYWLSAALPAWIKPNRTGIGTISQPRYLSSEGRLFFDGAEALVPQDTNGRVDVYEYEPGGVGGCRREGGCVYLISGGTGSKDSIFADATLSGNDAFFISESALVPQDTDSAFDMYDARACTDGTRCFPVSPVLPPACTSADACRPGPTPQPPIFGAPASGTFSGPGNPVQVAPILPVTKQGGKPKAKSRHKGHGRKHRKKARKSRVGRSSRGGARR